jgi:hypothetical protein
LSSCPRFIEGQDWPERGESIGSLSSCPWFIEELGLCPNPNSEGHTRSSRSTQTSLETFETKVETLGSKAEASMKELEQQRGRLRPTGSTGHRRPGHPEPSEPQLSGSTYPLQVTRPLLSRSPGTALKTAREFAPKFRSMDLPNHL